MLLLAEKIISTLQMWDKIVSLGPKYGYFANPEKTWLIVKPKHQQSTEQLFRDTGVNITLEGKRHLGEGIGQKSFVKEYMTEIGSNCLPLRSHTHNKPMLL